MRKRTLKNRNMTISSTGIVYIELGRHQTEAIYSPDADQRSGLWNTETLRTRQLNGPERLIHRWVKTLVASTGLTGPGVGEGDTSYGSCGAQRGSEVHNCIHARSEIRISHVDLFFKVVIGNQNYSLCRICPFWASVETCRWTRVQIYGGIFTVKSQLLGN